MAGARDSRGGRLQRLLHNLTLDRRLEWIRRTRSAAVRSRTVADANGSGSPAASSVRRKAAHSRRRCSKSPSEIRARPARRDRRGRVLRVGVEQHEVGRDARRRRGLGQPEPVAVAQRRGHGDRAAARRQRGAQVPAPRRERVLPVGAQRRRASRPGRAPGPRAVDRRAPRASTSQRPAGRRSRRASRRDSAGPPARRLPRSHVDAGGRERAAAGAVAARARHPRSSSPVETSSAPSATAAARPCGGRS